LNPDARESSFYQQLKNMFCAPSFRFLTKLCGEAISGSRHRCSMPCRIS
jgi:hypothetical protein